MKISRSFAVLLLLASVGAFGASVPVRPANSVASQYRDGWVCAHGFRRLGDNCVAVVVPANGYLSSTGNEWECNRGYLKAGLTCGLVRMPANAHADDSASGTGWQCDRGFRETNHRVRKGGRARRRILRRFELQPRLGLRTRVSHRWREMRARGYSCERLSARFRR